MHLSIFSKLKKPHTASGRFVVPHFGANIALTAVYVFMPIRSAHFTEAVTVPFQILLVVCRHMLSNGAVLPRASFQTMMGSNAVMVVENFNRGVCYPYINFLFDVFIRNGV